jgi:hypothetical protein
VGTGVEGGTHQWDQRLSSSPCTAGLHLSGSWIIAFILASAQSGTSGPGDFFPPRLAEREAGQTLLPYMDI